MRIEKNRKHLATLIAVVLGVAIMSTLNILWSFSSEMITATIWTSLAVLVVRAAVIESGFRRSTNRLEKNLDRAGGEIAAKYFGVVALPHERKGESDIETEER
jgi:hypothetical protein